MGTDWGEYYGTEDPDEMMMEIEKESRRAAMEDGIEEELDADEQVLAFINSQSTDNLMFVANKLFAFSNVGRNAVDGDNTFISGIREKYGSQASIDARNKIRNRCCIIAVEHSEPKTYYYDGYVFRSGSGEKEEYVHSGNVFYCEFCMWHVNTGKVDWIPNLFKYRNWRKFDNFSNKSLLLDDRNHAFLNVQRLEDKVYLTKIGDDYLRNVMREAEKEEADRKAEKFGPDLGSDELPF